MVKKIKASKFHVSRVYEEAELQAVMMVIKEEFDKLKIPQEIVDFDTDLAGLIVKHLMRVPIEEVERFYGDRSLVKVIQNTVEFEEKYPNQGSLGKQVNFYV